MRGALSPAELLHVVPAAGVEPATSRLGGERSSAELRGRCLPGRSRTCDLRLRRAARCPLRHGERRGEGGSRTRTGLSPDWLATSCRRRSAGPSWCCRAERGRVELPRGLAPPRVRAGCRRRLSAGLSLVCFLCAQLVLAPHLPALAAGLHRSELGSAASRLASPGGAARAVRQPGLEPGMPEAAGLQPAGRPVVHLTLRADDQDRTGTKSLEGSYADRYTTSACGWIACGRAASRT